MEEFSFVEELLTVGDGILSRIKQLSFLRLRLLAPLDEKTYLDQHWAEEREKRGEMRGKMTSRKDKREEMLKTRKVGTI